MSLQKRDLSSIFSSLNEIKPRGYLLFLSAGDLLIVDVDTDADVGDVTDVDVGVVTDSIVVIGITVVIVQAAVNVFALLEVFIVICVVIVIDAGHHR
jgi:hypothetical protein